MPQATDMTINNGSAVAKVFTLLEPAAGGGASAKWALKEGANWLVFPKIEASSRKNNNRDAQKLAMTFTFPSSYVDAASTLTVVKNNAVVNVSVTLPDDFPEAKKDDLVAFVANGMNHALIKAMVRDARAAT